MQCFTYDFNRLYESREKITALSKDYRLTQYSTGIFDENLLSLSQKIF